MKHINIELTDKTLKALDLMEQVIHELLGLGPETKIMVAISKQEVYVGKFTEGDHETVEQLLLMRLVKGKWQQV